MILEDDHHHYDARGTENAHMCNSRDSTCVFAIEIKLLVFVFLRIALFFHQFFLRKMEVLKGLPNKSAERDPRNGSTDNHPKLLAEQEPEDKEERPFPDRSLYEFVDFD